MLESICRLRSVHLYRNNSKRNWAREGNVLAGCFEQVLRISSKSALLISSTSQLPILRRDYARCRISTRSKVFTITKSDIQIKHQANRWRLKHQQKTVGVRPVPAKRLTSFRFQRQYVNELMVFAWVFSIPSQCAPNAVKQTQQIIITHNNEQQTPVGEPKRFVTVLLVESYWFFPIRVL